MILMENLLEVFLKTYSWINHINPIALVFYRVNGDAVKLDPTGIGAGHSRSPIFPPINITGLDQSINNEFKKHEQQRGEVL